MAERPKALIIGDSISQGYTPHVERLLAGRFDVVHNAGNARDSANVLANLDRWLAADSDAALVHFNCGLHDLRVDRQSGKFQVPPDDYRRNLQQIAARLRAAGARLVWATITPVIERWHRRCKPFDRRQQDVEQYNRIALEVVSAAGIAVNDLHDAVVRIGPQSALSSDGVHMTGATYKALAEKVAATISSRLGGKR